MYRETYRCKDMVCGRSCGSAIYFLLSGNAFSHLHRMETDEVYHFHLGSPVELLEISAEGVCVVHTLGVDILAGQVPQLVIPGGSWQGSHLAKGGDYALLSTTMSPAFIPADYENASRAEMLLKYPQHKDLITLLTNAEEEL